MCWFSMKYSSTVSIDWAIRHLLVGRNWSEPTSLLRQINALEIQCVSTVEYDWSFVAHTQYTQCTGTGAHRPHKLHFRLIQRSASWASCTRPKRCEIWRNRQMLTVKYRSGVTRMCAVWWTLREFDTEINFKGTRNERKFLIEIDRMSSQRLCEKRKPFRSAIFPFGHFALTPLLTAHCIWWSCAVLFSAEAENGIRLSVAARVKWWWIHFSSLLRSKWKRKWKWEWRSSVGSY